jgi:outer membrane protein assembly factor BamB
MRCFVLLLSLALAPGALSADWPQWRGLERTGHAPAGVAVPTALSAAPKVVWRIKIGEGLASPVVSSGKVFYADNQKGLETLHAADAKNANELWHADVDQITTDSQDVPGPRCAPLVDGNRVYVQSCRSELRCLNVADGSLVWRVNYVKDFGAVFTGNTGNAQGAARHGNSASPVVDGTVLYAMVGGTNGASVVAFDKATGRVIWKSQNDAAAFAAPVITDVAGVKQLVAFTVDGVIGLALKDGRLLWRVPLKTVMGRHVTTPVVVDDMVLVASYQLGLVGIKVSRSGDDWQAAQAWVAKEFAVNFSCPVAAGNYLYGLGPTKNLFCADVKTGKPAWSKTGYFDGAADHSHAGFIVLGGNILMLTDGGELVIYDADPKEFKEAGRLTVCGKNWCDPAYANGRLYLRDERELLCVDLLP